MTTLATRTEELPTATLQEMAGHLVNDFQGGADLVLAAVLNALEARLPESEFVEFCRGLE